MHRSVSSRSASRSASTASSCRANPGWRIAAPVRRTTPAPSKYRRSGAWRPRTVAVARPATRRARPGRRARAAPRGSAASSGRAATGPVRLRRPRARQLAETRSTRTPERSHRSPRAEVVVGTDSPACAARARSTMAAAITTSRVAAARTRPMWAVHSCPVHFSVDLLYQLRRVATTSRCWRMGRPHAGCTARPWILATDSTTVSSPSPRRATCITSRCLRVAGQVAAEPDTGGGVGCRGKRPRRSVRFRCSVRRSRTRRTDRPGCPRPLSRRYQRRRRTRA